MNTSRAADTLPPRPEARGRRAIVWTLTALSIVANLVMILTATGWSGVLLLLGTIGVLISGINAPPNAFWYVLGMSAAFLFPAVVAAVVTGAHLTSASWRWRWQVVALIVWTIEYGSFVPSFVTEALLPELRQMTQ